MSSASGVKVRALTHLGDVPIATFFDEYWQQKPLVARQVLPNFVSPLEADEIAGLCLEDDVESRLVIEGSKDWDVKHGPLEEKVFAQLPERMWSILVQHADSLDPKVNALLDHFRFIPNWRLDDIMVSYAVDGGGVGPHFDYYDVFLLQAKGQRRWRIGQKCNAESALMPNQAMKILQEFDTQDEWILEPGDLLYVPANTAHWGEAIGDSITYSIGFRAPSHAEFLLDYSQDLAAACSEDQRFRDRKLEQQTHPGLISKAVITQFKDMFLRLGNDEQALGRWLGEYSTRLKQDIGGMYPSLSPDELHSNTPCTIHPHARVAYLSEANGCRCFINGVSAHGSEDLANKISEKDAFQYQDFSREDKKVLDDLAQSHLLVAIKDLEPTDEN